ncbi:MAG: type IIL restriction-modification enzyme MmeI, partial [Methylophilaceae bacterium]|nr:type IIL restriction-modification enzyme MmeI [Methylophilaceae bacterium]
CIWIDDKDVHRALEASSIRERVERVRNFRLNSTKTATRDAATRPHRFDERKPLPESRVLVVPIRSSENRQYLPVGFLEPGTVIANTAFLIVDSPIWTLALIASRLHTIWIGTVCARLELRFSYTNTVGWNTFPVPLLTEQNKADLTRCAEDILLAREAHFPATIADLYDPDNMPENLRHAHERNDEVLERIFIGRRFRNDTERLEKLFELYTKMTAEASKATPKRKGKNA